MCWENWACGECGVHLRCPEPPKVCPECGIAGGSFVAAARHAEESSDPGYLQRMWFEAGFLHPSLVAAADEQPPT